MRSAWRLLDPNDLDGTFEDWLVAVTPIVEAQRFASARLAAGFVSAVRSQELRSSVDGFTPVLAGDVNRSALLTSMLVTGPVSVRANLGRKMPIEQAMSIGEGRSAKSAMRYVLNGGRETVVTSVRADRRARGWERIASAKACDFCSMLAGRGAVYGETTADFQAHDGCSCSAAPVYR